MATRNQWLYGSGEAPPGARALRAGPVEMVFHAGDLRYLCAGGVEVVRRIYAAVRDPDWGTVPARITGLVVNEQGDGFEIEYEAEHLAPPVHFRWRAKIRGTADGVVRFEMDGAALTGFRRNRIGLCVHHPVEGFAGRAFEVEAPDGARRRVEVPEWVSPHQPLKEVRALEWAWSAGRRAALRFEGEVFETEDQRNWCDASFKTYGTPLALPFPVDVEAGTRIRQSVELRVQGAPAAPGPRRAAPVGITLQTGAHALPALGVAAGAAAPAPERLRALRLSHFRVEADRIEQALPQVRDARAPVELVVLVQRDAEAEVARAVEDVRRWKLDVARYVVLDAGAPATTAATAAAARRIVPRGRLMVGTRGHFAELNRNRPEAGSFDGLCFTATPQVHATDLLSLAENAAAFESVLPSAARIAAGARVYLSPVTLKVQFSPVAATQPEGSDERQPSLFCAAWTVAALASMARGGVAGATIYEAAGPKGVMDARGVYPVWHVLADAGAFRGALVRAVDAEAPREVACLALAAGDRLRLLVANMAAGAREVEVRGVPAGPARLRVLDAAAAAAAAEKPDAFRAAMRAVEVRAGRVRLAMDACAVATIDFGPDTGA